MVQTNVQGKGDKVAATQGKVTAQNPSNQSKEKYFGVFADEDLKGFSKYFDKTIVDPNFFETIIHMAHRALKGGRMSADNKATIRIAFAMFGDLVFSLGREYEKLTSEK